MRERDMIKERADDKFGRRVLGGLIVLLIATAGTLVATWATVINDIEHISDDISDIKHSISKHTTREDMHK